MAQIGIGIVGCGHNGLSHALTWQKMDGARIVGVCDIDESSARKRADMFGVKAFTRVEDLAAEPGVDAIDVVTSGSHRDPAVIAAEAGKHVLVENPFTVTVEEADDMIAAAERAGTNLMYAQTWRYGPSGMRTKELIDRGEIGDPISIAATYISNRAPGRRLCEHCGAYHEADRWSRWTASGGGFFIYEGTHFFDQVKWLMGSEIDTVFAVGMGRYILAGDGEDNGMAGFRFESGSFGTLHHGSSNPGQGISGWTVVGTGGVIEFTGGGELRLGTDEWRTIQLDDQGNGFQVEFTEFLDSIIEGRQPSCTGHDGRQSTAAAQAVHTSHESGQPVRLAGH